MIAKCPFCASEREAREGAVIMICGACREEMKEVKEVEYEEHCPQCNCGDNWLSKLSTDGESIKGKLYCLECCDFITPKLLKKTRGLL